MNEGGEVGESGESTGWRGLKRRLNTRRVEALLQMRGRAGLADQEVERLDPGYGHTKRGEELDGHA